ncbi:MAG: TauD/TfdA family dioxygenase [Defluviicoccus sp.]|nr:TauD/TfdA family dioxygenase [Defluviicoccus sp.]MDE0385722.1 TauD/TfdA family dioxygenase [Defluviicoccus sp.]
MKFDTVPLSSALAAEVRGPDLSQPLDPTTVAALRAAWLEHKVLVFRDQRLDVEAQARFASYFGPASHTQAPDARSRKHDPDRRVLLITNLREDGRPIGFLPDGELQFHSDSAFLERPLMATVLYAVEVTDRGGETLFANACMACAALDPGLRARLEGRRAFNVYDYTTQVKSGTLDRAGLPQAVHPVIRTHPETGAQAIYVNRLMTEEILDMPPAESAAILETLFAAIERPEFVYEHVWREGDLIIWDNRCTQHARRDFPGDQTRLMRRIGIAGDVPV